MQPEAQAIPRGVSIRVSTLVLVGVFLSLGSLLVTLRDVLPAAHVSSTIQYFSSDGAAYFQEYQEHWSDIAIVDQPLLLLTGTPIVLMNVADGNLILILAMNLLLMAVTMKAALDCLPTMSSRLAFTFGLLAFPYFLFGFLSLNKEVYAMCAAVYFGCYWLRGKRRYLVACLLLAFAARYYMLAAMLFLWAVFVRGRTPRYWLAFATLAAISVAAPLVKTRIPGYSSANLLDGAGVTSVLFSRAVDYFGYALIYPIKYLALIPGRIYSVAIGLGRPADPMEAVVSLLTLALLALAIYILAFKRSASAVPKHFALMALVAPIPIMWTEIGHWRYFSYVYVFLLFAAVSYFAERGELRRTASVNV